MVPKGTQSPGTSEIAAAQTRRTSVPCCKKRRQLLRGLERGKSLKFKTRQQHLLLQLKLLLLKLRISITIRWLITTHRGPFESNERINEKLKVLHTIMYVYKRIILLGVFPLFLVTVLHHSCFWCKGLQHYY